MRWTVHNTMLDRWSERDRAYVGLAEVGTGHAILAVWDVDVGALIEDGFLDPRDLHGSAVWYANHLGLEARPEP